MSLDPRLIAVAETLGLSDPEGVLLALGRLYAEIDAEVAAHSQGLSLPCHAGCDACCKESVFLSAPELLAVVAELLATRTPDELRRLVQDMGAIAARYEDELEMLETFEAGRERDEVAARVKFDCPLLEEGRCTVYASRELNARTFGAAWDPQHGEAYGCSLTRDRLRVLGPEAGPGLFDAREARRRLVAAVPATERVHVYPWWFAKIADALAG